MTINLLLSTYILPIAEIDYTNLICMYVCMFHFASDHFTTNLQLSEAILACMYVCLFVTFIQ